MLPKSKYDEAISAGYSDEEIQSYLTSKHGDKIRTALESGYSLKEISDYVGEKGDSIPSSRVTAFPSRDSPPAEIPATKSGLAGDIVGGVAELPTTLIGGLVGPIGGGVAAAGGALGTAFAGGSLKDIGGAAKEHFERGSDATETALGLKPETYSGQRTKENIGNLFHAAITGIGGAYEWAKSFLDKSLLEYARSGGAVSESQFKQIADKIATSSGQSRPLVEGALESALTVAGARYAGRKAGEGIEATQKRIQERLKAKDKETTPEEAPKYIKEADQPYATLPEMEPRAPQYGRGQVPDYPEYTRDLAGGRQLEFPSMAQERAAPVPPRPIEYPGGIPFEPGLSPQFQHPGRPSTAMKRGIRPEVLYSAEKQPVPGFEGPRQAPPVDPLRGMEAAPEPFRGPANPQLTPEQQARAARGEPYVSYDPADPRMGLEATTTRGIRTAGEEIPGISYEQLGGNPKLALGATGWTHANPRVTEALSRDSILKGMMTRMSNQERILGRLRDEQGRLHAEYGDKRIRGQVGTRRAQELVAYTKSMQAVERDVAKTRDLIDRRVQATEERIRSEPRFDRGFEGDLRKNRPHDRKRSSMVEDGTFHPRVPKGQRGVINQRILLALATLGASEFARAGYHASKKIRNGFTLDATVEKVFNSHSGEVDLPSLKVRLMKNDRVYGFAEFIRDQERDNLYSKWTHTDDFSSSITPEGQTRPATAKHRPEVKKEQIRGQFYSSDIYKFAAELGNTIEPDTLQTLSGEGMWRKFQDRGIAVIGPEGTPIIPPGGPKGPKSQRGGITPDLLTLGLSRLINKSVKPTEPGPTKTKSDVLAAATGENRPWADIKKTLLTDIEDLPGSVWEKGLEYASNAQMVFHNSKNAVVKYVADYVANEKAQSTLRTDIATDGINMGGHGLVLPKRVVDPNSPKSTFQGLSSSEKETLVQVINKFSDRTAPSPDQMRAAGASKKVMDAIETLQKPLRDFLGDANAELIRLGRKPIKEIPFYFMKAAGTGNFLARAQKIIGKDKNGDPIYETIAFHRAQTKMGANAIVEGWKKQFGEQIPDLVTRVDTANSKTQGNKFTMSPTLLEDIYNALERDDPRRAALMSAAQEISSKAGKMGAHRAWRKGVEGMDLTPKNFWSTYEGYLKDGNNYIANLRLSNLIKDVQLTTDMPPRLKQWTLDYLNRSRGGGSPDGVLDALERGMDNVTTTLGLAPGVSREIVKFSNKLFTSQALFFGNIPFLMGQALQSTTFAPAVLSHYKFSLGYDKGSVAKSLVNGTMRLGSKDKEFQKTIDFLSSRGKIDPTLIQEFSLFGEGRAKASQAFDYLAQWSFIPRKLEGLNRMHAAAIAYDFLKDNGYKGKELNIQIERMVDDVMGNYSYSDRPGIVTRTGILGEAIAPLQTFKNWFVGMSLVMAKEAARGVISGDLKKTLPFASLWLGTAITGGVIGTIAFKELDLLWDWMKSNKYTQKVFGINENTPSLTEAILTSDLPDSGKFGILSGATTMIDPRGVYISGSMSAPEYMPSVMTHGMSNLTPGPVKMANYFQVFPYLMDSLGAGDLTTEDRKRILKGMLPASWGKAMDNIDSTWKASDMSMNPMDALSGVQEGFEGKPVPGGKRGFGTVERPEAWDIGASILGGGSLTEKKEKMAIGDIKDSQAALSAKRTRLVDLTVDAIMQGRDIDKYVDQAVALDFADFNNAIKQAYENRLQTESGRLVGRGKTPTQAKRAQYIKEATQ